MPKWNRPSPAMVIAVIALVVAMGGTGYAAFTLPKNSVGNKQLKKNAVTSVKVKDGSLLKRDFRAGQLPAGPRGPKGDPGTNGTNGTNGAPGSALGFAHVTDTGTVAVDAANSKNVTTANVSRGGTGLYCFKDLPFTPHNAVANSDADSDYSFNVATSIGTTGLCPSGTQAFVTIDRPSDVTNQNGAFYIVFN